MAKFELGRAVAALSAALILLTAGTAVAANGTWTSLTSGGRWSSTGNWLNGTVADGSGSTANFSTLDLTADNTVHLDGSRTISALIFGDTDTSTVGNWLLDNNANDANVLTLDGITPTITVNAMGSGARATISAAISGSANLTKAGTGTLMLTGTNSYNGAMTVSNGALYISTAYVVNNVLVNAGAAFGVVNLSDGQSALVANLALGNSSGPATLVFANVANVSVPVLTVFGTVTLNANCSITIADNVNLVAGKTYPLLGCGSIVTNSGTGFGLALPTGVYATLTNDTSLPGLALSVTRVCEAKILTFNYGANPGTISGTNITLTVPYDTDVTALAPTYTMSVEATGSPASGIPRNFATPQTYTVISGDGSITNLYTVAVIKSAFIRFADMVEVAASSQYDDTTYAAVNAFNGSGLSADGNTHQASGFWCSLDVAISNEWVKVRFDRSYPLSHLRVWNYNESGYLGCGVQSADVYVINSDLDPGNNTHLNGLPFAPTGWTRVLANRMFAPAPSPDGIINTDPYISLGGVTARQLAIKVNANWGYLDYAGLDEVQIYPVVQGISEALILTFDWGNTPGIISGTNITLTVPYDTDVTTLAPTYTMSPGATGSPASGTARNFTTPQPYTVVSGDGAITNVYTVTVIKSALIIRFAHMVEVAASSEYDASYAPVNAFNGSGLLADGNTHMASGWWCSAGNTTPDKEWLKVRFDRSYPLDHLRVWNYNESDYLGSGLSSADIYVIDSDVDPGNNTHLNGLPFDPTGWARVLTNQTFVQAPISGNITNTDPYIRLGGVTARQLAIKVNANWGPGDYVGLDEVQIYLTPPTPPTPELPGSALTMSSLGVPTFNFSTVVGYRYRLVYTDNLATPTAAWQPVTPPADGWVLATGATMSLTDTNGVGQAHRFYRLEAANP